MVPAPRFSVVVLILLGVASFFTTVEFDLFRSEPLRSVQKKFETKDNDWFMLQRVFPYDDIGAGRYEEARRILRERAALSTERTNVAWQSVGPSNIGGRITAIALDPSNTNVIYAGAASGGLWKSTDGGVTWSNIFNETPSIGSLLFDPVNPQTVYVGTGEANPGGVAIYPGNGLWRSTDGGMSWTSIGLENSGHIGKIEIHSTDPATIFVAALGHYRSRTDGRGIYRSTNSGATWERVLFLNDTTGASDVLINPANPSIVLAALWTRYRPLTYSVISGRNTGLWRSTDGGTSWTQVTNGFPSNDPNLGRISLAASASQPNIIYAIAADGVACRGVFRSTDSGESWAMIYGGSAFSEPQFWYNNVLAVHPRNPNILFAGMVQMWRSVSGGTSWSNVRSTMHVDQHAIVFDPQDSTRVIVGNDGGVYSSTNLGSPWVKSYNLPISQFYAGTVDYSNPQRYYGGTQDNGTLRTLTGSVDDWAMILGGDGFYVAIDPTNPNRIYAEFQNGGLRYSTDGGATWQNGRNGVSSSDRTNWSTPFVMDFNTPMTLYVGTFRVYKTTNGMANWSPISGDLTRGPNGRLGTITTIDVARSDPNVLYVGTDDGKVSATTDGGVIWQDVTADLPIRYVTQVRVDPESANVAYVTHSGYLEYAYQSHIHKTTDYGSTWTSIGGDLPDIPLNDVIVDPLWRPYLYVATDMNVMYSSNGGESWHVLGAGFPEVPVHKLTLHSPTRKLVAFTHGRSAYAIDLTGLVSVTPVAAAIPEAIALHQNFPNPFNPLTTIRFDLHRAGRVTLAVFDVTGREIATLTDAWMEPGAYESYWSAENVASGVYFYRLKVEEQSLTRRLVVVR